MSLVRAIHDIAASIVATKAMCLRIEGSPRAIPKPRQEPTTGVRTLPRHDDVRRQTELAEARNITAHAREPTFGALDCIIDANDEALVDSLVKPGHPSTPGYNDPQYPLEGRQVQ